MVVLEVLNELGYVTHEAVDYYLALKLVDSGVRLDLLVTDVGLPGTNGRQLMKCRGAGWN
jgi:CheY-like chemotaxis protein